MAQEQEQPAPGTLYKYVDKTGSTHFVDSLHKVPKAYRKQTQTIQFEAEKPTPVARTIAEKLPDTQQLTQEVQSELTKFVGGNLKTLGLSTLTILVLGIVGVLFKPARAMMLKFAVFLIAMGLGSSAYLGWVASK